MTIDTDNKIALAVTPVQDSPGVTKAVGIPKDWDEINSAFKGNIQTIDLRLFDDAQAITAVSFELRYLHPKSALLFVLQNHLPAIFLDKLGDDKFDYHIKIIAPGEVRTLIFWH